MPTIYVFCGLPGSGKTTKSRELAEDYNIRLCSFDELYKSQHLRKRSSVRLDIYKRMAATLSKNCDLVYDDLNTDVHDRKILLHVLSGIDCKKVLIVMNTPLEECLRRNASRVTMVSEKTIYNLNDSFQSPSLEEGWDEIMYID